MSGYHAGNTVPPFSRRQNWRLAGLEKIRKNDYIQKPMENLCGTLKI